MAGKVYLVGAGPGDPGLLTLRGKACLETADVVLYDRLVSPEILLFAAKSAQRVDVGKRPDNHRYRQEEINTLLVEQALAGKRVVRLKGGDPFVFGRGGEEAQVLARHGIDFEVVPGVTSAVAALAYAGIPVTHRDYAPGFHVVTGHACLTSTSSDAEWLALAHSQGTLVVLMGLAQVAAISHRLMALGKAADTPAAVISKATTADQQMAVGTLATLATVAADERIVSPAILVIGGVVDLASQIAWFHPQTATITESEQEKEGRECPEEGKSPSSDLAQAVRNT
ncbi:uroporphyrinogen-III C-methyltransferase [Alicyclobacillaceae bacterium I2511]|nr:uroporphyrinogen-III C-methyltransferase [Alicyclobacillaceae bacterium I2511]